MRTPLDFGTVLYQCFWCDYYKIVCFKNCVELKYSNNVEIKVKMVQVYTISEHASRTRN